MASSFIPGSDRVLVEVADMEKTRGGIIVPENQRGREKIGKIIAVGPGRRDSSGNLFPPPWKAGQTVQVDDPGGSKVTVDGRPYLLCRQEEILGEYVDVVTT